jgi:hypothetical protein
MANGVIVGIKLSVAKSESGYEMREIELSASLESQEKQLNGLKLGSKFVPVLVP